MSAADAPWLDDRVDGSTFDVIAACQLWLELDFPDRSDTESESGMASGEEVISTLGGAR